MVKRSERIKMAGCLERGTQSWVAVRHRESWTYRKFWNESVCVCLIITSLWMLQEPDDNSQRGMVIIKWCQNYFLQLWFVTVLKATDKWCHPARSHFNVSFWSSDAIVFCCLSWRTCWPHMYSLTSQDYGETGLSWRCDFFLCGWSSCHLCLRSFPPAMLIQNHPKSRFGLWGKIDLFIMGY